MSDSTDRRTSLRLEIADHIFEHDHCNDWFNADDDSSAPCGTLQAIYDEFDEYERSTQHDRDGSVQRRSD